jgi:chromosome segregation ATPase
MRGAKQPNCKRFLDEYTRLDHVLTEARNRQSQHESRVREFQSTIDRAESSARSETQSHSSRLRGIRDEAESRYSRASSALNQAQSRLATIRSELPRLREQVKDAEAELPGLRDQLVTAESDVVVKTQARDAFSASIGFAAAEAAYLAADKLLKDVISEIAVRTKEIASSTKSLAEAQRKFRH